MYSQNNEEEIILNYFGDFKGHLLSLGENDGITLSNSRALIEKGWSADLVEPASRAFKKLNMLYEGLIYDELQRIKLHNIAIGNKNGEMNFYESDSLLNKGDTDLVSTLSINETKRWSSSITFIKSKITVLTVSELLYHTLQRTFDFITIDCEGYDWDILRQMDLNELKCKMLCIETNGKNEGAFIAYMKHYEFKLIHKNAENHIYVKR